MAYIKLVADILNSEVLQSRAKQIGILKRKLGLVMSMTFSLFTLVPNMNDLKAQMLYYFIE